MELMYLPPRQPPLPLHTCSDRVIALAIDSVDNQLSLYTWNQLPSLSSAHSLTHSLTRSPAGAGHLPCPSNLCAWARHCLLVPASEGWLTEEHELRLASLLLTSTAVTFLLSTTLAPRLWSHLFFSQSLAQIAVRGQCQCISPSLLTLPRSRHHRSRKLPCAGSLLSRRRASLPRLRRSMRRRRLLRSSWGQRIR